MTGMNQIGVLSPYPAGKGDCLVNGLMAVVRFLAQGIDNERLAAQHIRNFLFGDRLHISNIRQLPYAESTDRQIVVHHLEWNNVDVANTKRHMLLHLVQLNGRHARIAVFGKAVRQHLKQALTGYGVGIDINLTKLAVGADIVHTTHVVIVSVRNENAVDTTERQRHYLLAEIGTAVDEQTCRCRFYQRRTAQTLVLGIGTLTDLTLTANGWHATRRSCA